MMPDDKPGVFRTWADALCWVVIVAGFDLFLYPIPKAAMRAAAVSAADIREVAIRIRLQPQREESFP